LIGVFTPPSPDGDRKTSPNPDKFLLQQRNGNLGQSITPDTPLTMSGSMVNLDPRIAAPQGGRYPGFGGPQFALRRLPDFFKGNPDG
jgi:hypothetical protein